MTTLLDIAGHRTFAAGLIFTTFIVSVAMLILWDNRASHSPKARVAVAMADVEAFRAYGPSEYTSPGVARFALYEALISVVESGKFGAGDFVALGSVAKR